MRARARWRAVKVQVVRQSDTVPRGDGEHLVLDVAKEGDVGDFASVLARGKLGRVIKGPLAAALAKNECAAFVWRWENDDKTSP